MNKFIFAANFKCNHTRESFDEYARILGQNLNGEKVIIFPPFSAFIKGDLGFIQGAQNFYPVKNGAFTGEIGLDMLDEFDIKTVIIGHSERRQILGENDEILRQKFDFAKARNFTIVYCIGEDLATYESGKTKEFLSSQLKNIDLDYVNLIIAYEPIWAIGSGKTPSMLQIGEILDFIATLSKAPLLYGGSVNAKNIAEISRIPNCGGVLVGSASLNAQNFLNLIKETK